MTYIIVCLLTAAKTLLQCRDNGINRNVRISCPCGQIHIRSAFVGFSRQPCPRMETFCIREVTNIAPIMNCNRNTTCTIPGNILRYQTDDEQCKQPKKGRFIYITYDCINSGKKRHRFMDFMSDDQTRKPS